MLVDYKVKLGRRAGQLAFSGNLAYLTSSQILLPVPRPRRWPGPCSTRPTGAARAA
jgi:hypothetical protein